jgi:hypothetical protein
MDNCPIGNTQKAFELWATGGKFGWVEIIKSGGCNIAIVNSWIAKADVVRGCLIIFQMN